MTEICVLRRTFKQNREENEDENVGMCRLTVKTSQSETEPGELAEPVEITGPRELAADLTTRGRDLLLLSRLRQIQEG